MTVRSTHAGSYGSLMCVTHRVIGTGPDDLLLAAAEVCPTTAIRIVDQQTGEQVYP
jgi:hypothetical protein